MLLGFLAEDTIGEFLGYLPGFNLTSGRLKRVWIAIAAVIQMVFGELAPKNIAYLGHWEQDSDLGPIMGSVGYLSTRNGCNSMGLRIGCSVYVASNLWKNCVPEVFGRPRTSDRASGARTIRADDSLGTRTLQLWRKDAADALTPRTSMVGIKSSGTIADLVSIAKDGGYSRFPVTGQDTDDIVE